MKKPRRKEKAEKAAAEGRSQQTLEVDRKISGWPETKTLHCREDQKKGTGLNYSALGQLRNGRYWVSTSEAQVQGGSKSKKKVDGGCKKQSNHHAERLPWPPEQPGIALPSTSEARVQLLWTLIFGLLGLI